MAIFSLRQQSSTTDTARQKRSTNLQEPNNAEKSNSDNPQITSDGVSMPILDSDENAWPPPNIRQEVVQSAQEDAAQHQQGQAQQTASTSTTTPTDANQIVADGDSRAIANKNEGSWPPPNIRDEIVDAANQEETQHQQDQV